MRLLKTVRNVVFIAASGVLLSGCGEDYDGDYSGDSGVDSNGNVVARGSASCTRRRDPIPAPWPPQTMECTGTYNLTTGAMTGSCY